MRVAGGARCLILFLLATLVPRQGAAYNIASLIHFDCHERMTYRAALGSSSRPGFPATPSGADRTLAGALQFDISAYGEDLLTISLLLGARYNDIRDNSTLDLGGIVPVHNLPQRQREHFLRRAPHDGAAGLRQSMDEAIAYIRQLVSRATGDRDRLDPRELESVDIYLRYRGAARVKLSRLYFNLGRAVHVVQDSFSHTLRTADGFQILDVCNWIDDLDGTLDEQRDGCRHLSKLDNCECRSPAYDRLLRQTALASEEFIRAVLEPRTAAERESRIEAFITRWLTLKTGCSPANRYCDHALLADLADKKLQCPAGPGCGVGSGAGRGAGWFLPAAVLLLFVLAARGRRCTEHRAARGALLLALLFITPTRAEAEQRCKAPQPEPGLYLMLRNGVSSDRPALSLEGGALYRGRYWGIGLAGEYNPFLSFERGVEATSGAVNIVASGSLHIQLTHRLSMRFEARSGLSVLLFRSPGYDVGSLGLFLGLRALGLDYRIVSRLYLFVDPIDVALPVFKVDKLPFLYKQWRVGAGLGWRL